MRRNALTTLLLSQGTPMLLMGDEIGRTQYGNNNAYCQDKEINWLQWEDHDPEDLEFLEFVRRLIRLRRIHPRLRLPQFRHGQQVSEEVKDVTWLHPAGGEMSPERWEDAELKTLGLMHCDQRGACLLILINGFHESAEFQLPEQPDPQGWKLVMRTDSGQWGGELEREDVSRITLPDRCLMLLERHPK